MTVKMDSVVFVYR